jgi:hypothetical protein
MGLPVPRSRQNKRTPSLVSTNGDDRPFAFDTRVFFSCAADALSPAAISPAPAMADTTDLRTPRQARLATELADDPLTT